MFQPHEGDLGTKPTISTILIPCIAQCHGEGRVLWALLAATKASVPVAHAEVAPTFLPKSLNLWNPTLHQEISDISSLLAVYLNGERAPNRGNNDYTKTHTQHEKGKFKDLEEAQYTNLKRVRDDWPKAS